VSYVPVGPSPSYKLIRLQASIATDSHLRIHLSLDPSLTDWSLAHDIHIPTLAVPGSADEGTEEAQGTGSAGTAELATGGWGLSWCKEKWWGSVLACFAGKAPGVKVRRGSFADVSEEANGQIISLDPTPTTLLQLVPPSASASPLTALSWAPNCGRSCHYLATGARDGSVRIWKVTPPDADDGEAADKGWRGEVMAEFTRGARIGMVDVSRPCSWLWLSGPRLMCRSGTRQAQC
jgi:nucleoporin SEH1